MREELHSGAISIRRYRTDDVPRLFEAARESIGESFTRWMPWCHPNYTQDETVAFIQSRLTAWQIGEAYDFAVLDSRTGDLLGSVGLNQLNRTHSFANLGYWVRRSRMGQGVAVAAALLAARFGFEDLGLHRAEIVVATENVRSQRVAEKTRATREGVLRNRLLTGERVYDAVMYSLLPTDLRV